MQMMEVGILLLSFIMKKLWWSNYKPINR